MTKTDIKGLITTATTGGQLRAVGELLRGDKGRGMKINPAPGGILRSVHTLIDYDGTPATLVAAPPGYKIIVDVATNSSAASYTLNCGQVSLPVPANSMWQGRLVMGPRIDIDVPGGPVSGFITYHFERITLEDGLLGVWVIEGVPPYRDAVFGRLLETGIPYIGADECPFVSLSQYEPLAITPLEEYSYVLAVEAQRDDVERWFLFNGKDRYAMSLMENPAGELIAYLGDGTPEIKSQTPVVAGEHFVAVVVNDNATLYLDGAEVDSIARPTIPAAGAEEYLSVSQDAEGDTPPPKLLAVWSRTLSAVEIVELYNDGTPLTFEGRYFN